MKNTSNGQSIIRCKYLVIVAVCAFCILQLIVYIQCVILGQNLGGLPHSVGVYAAVVACFAFTLPFLFFLKSAKGAFLTAALLFTAAADYFLVFNAHEEQYLEGVVLFVAVQVLHMLCIFCGRTKKTNITSLILRLGVLVIVEAAVAIMLENQFGALHFFAIVSFTNLLISAAEMSVAFKANPLYAAGLILFVCCDISVALSFTSVTLSFIDAVTLVWIFYLPSQTLIALHAAYMYGLQNHYRAIDAIGEIQ